MIWKEQAANLVLKKENVKKQCQALVEASTVHTYTYSINDVLWLGIIAVISDGMMTYTCISLFIYNIYIYICGHIYTIYYINMYLHNI